MLAIAHRVPLKNQEVELEKERRPQIRAPISLGHSIWLAAISGNVIGSSKDRWWWPEATNVRALRIILVLGLVLVFVASFALAVTRDALLLPPVAVQRTASPSDEVAGKLLAHVDRFWYVFDEQGTLVAVPDEEVTEVRLSAPE